MAIGRKRSRPCATTSVIRSVRSKVAIGYASFFAMSVTDGNNRFRGHESMFHLLVEEAAQQ